MKRSAWLVLGLAILLAAPAAAEELKSALKKVSDQLYDARKDGLKSLSFDMRFDPPLPLDMTGQPDVASATVYWQSPYRFNVLLKDSRGRRVTEHPLLAWAVYERFLRESLPIRSADAQFAGSEFHFVPGEKGSVKRTKDRHSITLERPVNRNGKLVMTLKDVLVCDSSFHLLKILGYGRHHTDVKPGQPHYMRTYRTLDNGRCVWTGYAIGSTHRRSLTHTKVGKYWLPSKFNRTDVYPNRRESQTATFTRYKTNPRLSKSQLTPPKWPTARINLSTPERALRSFYDALYLGDLKAIRACLAKDSRAKWDRDVLQLHRDHPRLPPELAVLGYSFELWWSGFIHGNAGKTSKLILSDKKQTDKAFSAHLKTVTTGRPVDYRVKLVKEGRSWKIANLPSEFMKGYD